MPCALSYSWALEVNEFLDWNQIFQDVCCFTSFENIYKSAWRNECREFLALSIWKQVQIRSKTFGMFKDNLTFGLWDHNDEFYYYKIKYSANDFFFQSFVDLVLFKSQIQNQHLKFGTSCEAKAITKNIDVILVAFTFTMAWIFFQLLQRVMCNK